MTAEQFAETVSVYCTVTGAPAGVAETLRMHFRTIVGSWKCTPGEFGEIAYRIVARKQIPKWPNEHLSAIGDELDALRVEQAEKLRPARGEHECPVCDGIGLLTVPHPKCVYGGRVVGFYDDRARKRIREVVTIAVICTADRCWAGERALFANRAYADERGKPKLMTLEAYLGKVGLDFEPTVALRDYEREQSAKSREACPLEPGERNVYRSVVGNILARQRAWAREPEEVPA